MLFKTKLINQPIYNGQGQAIRLAPGITYRCSVSKGYVLALKSGESISRRPNLIDRAAS